MEEATVLLNTQMIYTLIWCFSVEAMTTIMSGVLNNKVRDEIVKFMSTLMMVHTLKLTPEG